MGGSGRSSAGGSGIDCKLALTIVRRNLSLTPETLDNLMDGHISCRHLVMRSFLVLVNNIKLNLLEYCNVQSKLHRYATR